MEYNFERKIDNLGRVVLPADGLLAAQSSNWIPAPSTPSPM